VAVLLPTTADSYQLVVEHAGEAWEWLPVAEGRQVEAFGFLILFSVPLAGHGGTGMPWIVSAVVANEANVDNSLRDQKSSYA
jgi:hypothetical protein